jgi:hypothetical protein
MLDDAGNRIDPLTMGDALADLLADIMEAPLTIGTILQATGSATAEVIEVGGSVRPRMRPILSRLNH